MVESFALVLALAGCGGTPMEHQLPVGRTRGYAQSLDTLGIGTDVDAPPDRIWTVLPAVYADLGLEITFREPANRRTGACHQRVRGRLGTRLLSRLIDCGETRSLPNADRYDVALTVLTTVVPNGEGSTVHTFVLGVGLDSSGSASSRLWCYTKASIEPTIVRGIEERLS